MDSLTLAAFLAGIAIGYILGRPWYQERKPIRRSLSAWIRMRYPRAWL